MHDEKMCSELRTFVLWISRSILDPLTYINLYSISCEKPTRSLGILHLTNERTEKLRISKIMISDRFCLKFTSANSGYQDHNIWWRLWLTNSNLRSRVTRKGYEFKGGLYRYLRFEPPPLKVLKKEKFPISYLLSHIKNETWKEK